jgi:hypothetical protein
MILRPARQVETDGPARTRTRHQQARYTAVVNDLVNQSTFGSISRNLAGHCDAEMKFG